MPRASILRLAVPLALAGLELGHPTWSGGVSQGVAAAGGWWIPLHLLLIAAYGVLIWLLWTPAVVARALLGLFAACNTAFLAVDGVAVGLLARSDPAAADAVWTSPMVDALANLTGAAWSAALLATAVQRYPADAPPAVVVESALTWAAFVASGFVPLAGAISRVLAVATGALAVQATGRAAVPFALLVFAAVLRQHVGPEAALGMLCITLALAFRRRSTPAAASRPSAASRG
jgi:hypothetical protein